MVMSKLDASTGDVIWSRTGLTDWPQNSDFAGGDLIVDDNSLLALYYGSETGNAVGNAIKVQYHRALQRWSAAGKMDPGVDQILAQVIGFLVNKQVADLTYRHDSSFFWLVFQQVPESV